MSQEEESEPEGMTFWEHLEELRSRLFKMALAAVAGGVVAWIARERILRWLVTPFTIAWQQQGFKQRPKLHFPNPAGLFIAYVKLALISGILLAMPIIFYQLWSFIAPGLYAKEKRFAVPFVFISTALFAGGAYFGMALAFPAGFQYLLQFAGTLPEFDIEPTIMVDDYVEFIARSLIAFGAVFELPVVVFFLTVAGVVNHTHLIRFFRYFVVVAFVLAAVLTPPDIFSQFLLAVPLIVLYCVSIGIAWLFNRNKNKNKENDKDKDKDK
jgi:sec-independent protein translocase protein TatC